MLDRFAVMYLLDGGQRPRAADLQPKRASYSSQSASVGLVVLNSGKRGPTMSDARGSVSVIVRANFVPSRTIWRSVNRTSMRMWINWLG